LFVDEESLLDADAIWPDVNRSDDLADDEELDAAEADVGDMRS
jgi:hypothetical protein